MSGVKGMKGQKWSDERKKAWKKKRYPKLIAVSENKITTEDVKDAMKRDEEVSPVQEVKDAIPETKGE